MSTVEDLYGPQRTLARDRAKELLETDHVRCNFQHGIEQQSSQRNFQTETAVSFREHEAAELVSSLRERAGRNLDTQNATHISLGSDTGPRTTVVRSDFTAKPTKRFQQVIPEGVHDIHLADMVPKYMVDKRFGESLYNSDFDGRKSYGEWSNRVVKEGHKVGRRHKSTGYQISTHFKLGSDPPDLVSETSRRFTEKQLNQSPLDSTSHPPAAKVESSSNVFRSGDYNLPSRSSRGHFLSIQKQDYVPPAGVPTTTKKAYSHILPRKVVAQSPGLSALRQILVEENTKSFQNPRDPTSTNITKAFLKYDRERTGFITEKSLRGVCRDLGIPISETEVSQLMTECDQDKDGKISYVEFTKYLTGQDESVASGEDMTTTNTRTYSAPRERDESERSRDTEETGVQKYTGAGYQDSTHFQFGNDSTPSSSVYTKDFNVESVRDAGRVRAVSPPSSKVMHEFPVISADTSMTTTSRRDFISHNLQSSNQRTEALNTNRARHKKLAVEFSCEKDRRDDSHKQSVTSSSYPAPPPGTQRDSAVNPTPREYRHLESDRALLHPPSGPPRSENMAQFGAPLKTEEEARERLRQAMSERTSRIKDSIQTHIVLGFDSAAKLSENMAEFGEKEAVNPHVPAAGKPNGPTQAYSVLSHEYGGEESGQAMEDNGVSPSPLQGVLQQRNFLKNLNPRDPLNINLRKAFLEYDKTLSGSISDEDVRKVCRDMQVELTEPELKKLMKMCDKNGDGQIDYHEFALHLSRQQQPSGSLTGKPRLLPPSLTSTTQHDFRDPTTKKLTPMQKVVMEQDSKRFTMLIPTHFYNTETQGDSLLSTTRKDFKPPAETLAS